MKNVFFINTHKTQAVSVHKIQTPVVRLIVKFLDSCAIIFYFIVIRHSIYNCFITSHYIVYKIFRNFMILKNVMKFMNSG